MEVLGEPVDPEKVILVLALLFVMYVCCTVLFVKDASKLAAQFAGALRRRSRPRPSYRPYRHVYIARW